MFKSRRRGNQLSQFGWLSFAALLVAVLITYFFPASSPTTTEEVDSPEAVVKQFYTYEQSGDFGSSWEMFHPLMKERFAKQTYIQQRAHIFMQHFGAETFEFELGDPALVSDWKMSPEAPLMPQAFKVPVTLSYQSAFGDFSIQQDVFVVQEEDKYLLMWPYSRQK